MYEGDELVPSTAKGNLGEYLQAVKDFLGVTPEYLKIGRVTGRLDGFLNMRPGQRKEFIGSFMPEVEEWSGMHKNAAKRLQLLNAQLKGLQVELDRIESRDELEAAARRAEADGTRLREEVRRYDTRLGAARGVLQELEPARNDILRRALVSPQQAGVFNPLPDLVFERETDAKRAAKQISDLRIARPTLERFQTIEATEEKIAQVREALGHAKGTAEAAAARRSEGRAALDRTLQAQQAAERSLRQATDSGTQLERLASQAEELSSRVASLTEEASGLPGAPDGATYDEVKAACDVLANLEAELAEARSAFPTPEVMETAIRSSLDDATMMTLEASLVTRTRELRERVGIARTRTTTIEAQAAFHSRFAGMHCSDPKCPFERHVEQFASAAEELVAKRDEITRLEERLQSCEQERQDMAAARSAAKSAAALHSRLRRHKAGLEAAGVWNKVGPSEAFLVLLTSTGTMTAEALSARKLLRALAVKRELSEARRSLDGIREREESLRALAAARAELEANHERTIADVAAARAAMSELDEEASRSQDLVSAQDAALQLLDQYARLLRREAEASTEAARLRDLSASLEALRERWEAASAEEAAANEGRSAAAASLEEAERTLGDARLRLGRRDEYEARLAEASGRVRVAQTVAEACHPAKGAPVEFLRDFLDTTRESVNTLLDMAMDGEFRLGFAVSDSEFRIPVSRGSGRVIPDVTETSDGQLALAKTILSLALVRQTVMASGGFNVICLDECDGPLDREKNRERFASIVDRLIDELGVEQLFAISHNDYLHAAPAGLILFPGHAMPVDDPGFMANKVVLARFD